MITVEVVYALPDRQVVEALTLTPPVTLAAAVRASAVWRRHRDAIDLARVGVFGVVRPPDWALSDGDRVEIYRPLTMSPTDARRRRAQVNA